MITVGWPLRGGRGKRKKYKKTIRKKRRGRRGSEKEKLLGGEISGKFVYLN